ncbi:substrate-binding periplasmic protein [Chromobacterium paludis]|uniref:Amino acid ABC transporter substrate-binding protein n=1 Tax=Chromobacterium paludis TaxID=2605945 RepID=A0A5C1DMX6_9NEIS|nr:transporter substrate-binding domain-containing protein [Chromobacterium paludis]QEL57228.1 amino acid ABC transporter substrate-binding protein [Chromobacterium paludis]
MKKLIALLLLALCSQSALAAPELVLAYSVFEPWKRLDAHGLPAGPYADIVRELARRLKLPLRFAHCPLSRCLAMMEQGRADLMIGVRPTPERSRYLDFLEPAFANGDHLAFYQRSDDNSVIARYEDLHARRVGVSEGVSYTPRFDGDAQLRRDASPGMESGFRKLAQGRVDVLIVNSSQGRELAARPEFAGKVKRAVLTLDDHHPNRLALARRSPLQPQKTRIQQALRGMVADGTIARLLSATP